MKRIIYSLYITIPKEELDWQPPYQGEKIPKTEVTHNAFLKHYDWLKQRHVQYAKSIGVKYKLYECDEEFNNFKSWFQATYPQITTYNIVNFYKIHLLYELAKEYDEILYIDFDVVPVTKDNFFKVWDVTNKGVAIKNNDKSVKITDVQDLRYFREIFTKKKKMLHSNRSPTAKFWNAKALLQLEGHSGINNVYNTGIIGISKGQCKKLDYWGDFDYVIEMMEELKTEQDGMWPASIQNLFGYDNETIWSFKAEINRVEKQWLDRSWHNFMDTIDTIPSHAKFVHVINKHFDFVRGWCEKNNI